MAKQQYLAKQGQYEEFVRRPPVVRVYRNDSNLAKFLSRPMWEGRLSQRARVLPGEYHVIDEQLGHRAFTQEELDRFYMRKPGRKAKDKTDS